MNISGIHSIIYGCEDLETAGRFLSDLGFEDLADDSAGASYGLADGTSLVLRPIDDNSLPAALVDGGTAREIIWRVESEEVLREIASERSDGSKRYRWIGDKERLVRHFERLAGRISRT